MKAILLFVLTLAVAAEFSNLDFEQADPRLAAQDHGPFGSKGDVSKRIPHWSFWLGDDRQSLIGHNRATIGGIISCLHDGRPFGAEFNQFPSPPFEGAFGFILKSQIRDERQLPSLRQEGVLSSEMRTIRILVFGDPIKIFLNDHPIILHYELLHTPIPILPYHPITFAYGDISAFSGKKVQLKIEPDSKNSIRTFCGIDSIEFLSESISSPEISFFDEDDLILLHRLK